MTIVSAEQLKIVSIRIESERFNRPLVVSGPTDKTTAGIVVEFNIYENLTKGYLTGNMILQDDQDIYRVADIVGTERVIFEFVTPDFSSDVISKTFIIEEVSESVKSNDFTSILSLSLVEDIKFYNDLNKFSKAYHGTAEQIIENIASDKLGREVVIESEIKSAQQAFRYIVPYQDPLAAIKTILSKMTTDSGLPFFFYSTILDDKFYLTDLQTIIQSEAFNKDVPFVFDQNNNVKNDIESQATNITHIDTGLLENTLRLSQDGGMGFKYESINATTGKSFITHIDMDKHFSELTEAELFPKDQNFIAFDKKFIADPSKTNDKTITDYDSRIHTKVVSQPYNDVRGFDEESFTAQERLRPIKKSVISHLLKNMYTINVAGLLFSINNIKTCVGHLINVDIYKSNQGYQSGEKVDEKRSGNYMIIAKRHCFDVVGERHTVSLELSKLASRSINL